MTTETFAGFPPETQTFLMELSANNEREWFTAHRREYDDYYVAPALRFIEAIGPRLVDEVSKETHYEARVNGTLFRINRDIRFSKDKTPYKNHLDLWFWQGARKGWDTTGFFFRLLPETLIIGAGLHRFGPEQIKKFRAAVLDDEPGRQLEALQAELLGRGYDSGEKSKGLPRGVDPKHPRAELTRLLGLIATLDTQIPPEAFTPAFVDYCIGHYKAMNPINEWLKAHVF